MIVLSLSRAVSRKCYVMWLFQHTDVLVIEMFFYSFFPPMLTILCYFFALLGLSASRFYLQFVCPSQPPDVIQKISWMQFINRLVEPIRTISTYLDQGAQVIIIY